MVGIHSFLPILHTAALKNYITIVFLYDMNIDFISTINECFKNILYIRAFPGGSINWGSINWGQLIGVN